MFFSRFVGKRVGGISPTISVALLHSAILVLVEVDATVCSPLETDPEDAGLVVAPSSCLGASSGSLRTVTFP
jgi:hypothetical protein